MSRNGLEVQDFLLYPCKISQNTCEIKDSFLHEVLGRRVYNLTKSASVLVISFCVSVIGGS